MGLLRRATSRGTSIRQATGGGVPSSRSFVDPLGLKKDKPKKPKKTAEELAAERRLRADLDKEIGKGEDLFKLLTSKQLGRQSLLSGAARTTTEAAAGGRRGGAAGAGSLLPSARPTGGRAATVRGIRPSSVTR